MTRKAKRASAPKPARFMVSTSTDPDNRFASTWEEATTDFASAIGHRLAKQSGRPTGIIHMTSDEVPLNSWIPFKDLKNAPSLKADYENLAQIQPGNEIYDANVRRYIGAWKSYWSELHPANDRHPRRAERREVGHLPAARRRSHQQGQPNPQRLYLLLRPRELQRHPLPVWPGDVRGRSRGELRP